MARFADWDLGSQPEEVVVPRRRRVSFQPEERSKKIRLEEGRGREQEARSRSRGQEARNREPEVTHIKEEEKEEFKLLRQVQQLGRRLSRKVSVAFGIS